MNSTYWINTIMSKMYIETPTNFYIGLSSTTPQKNGTGITEPTAADYSRVLLDSLSEPVDGLISNLSEIDFGESTSVWFDEDNPATYYAVFDGNDANARFLFGDVLTPSRIIFDGVTIKMIPHSLKISLLDLIEDVVI